MMEIAHTFFTCALLLQHESAVGHRSLVAWKWQFGGQIQVIVRLVVVAIVFRGI